MIYQYFKISALYPEQGAEALNSFIATHAIASITEQFVADGQNSFWSVRVTVVGSHIAAIGSQINNFFYTPD